MAKFGLGILDGISGRLGNIVGGKWKGISYLRTAVLSPKNPKTVLQVSQRTKFALIGHFLHLVSPLIRIGFSGYTEKQTAFDAAFSYNIKNAVTGTYPNFTLDYSRVKVSQGNLAPTLDANLASGAAGVITVTWNPEVETNQGEGTDTAMILVYNPARNQTICKLNAADRSAGTADVNIPSFYSGDTVHCYLAFVSKSKLTVDKQEAVSDSVYAGNLLVS